MVSKSNALVILWDGCRHGCQGRTLPRWTALRMVQELLAFSTSCVEAHQTDRQGMPKIHPLCRPATFNFVFHSSWTGEIREVERVHGFLVVVRGMATGAGGRCRLVEAERGHVQRWHPAHHLHGFVDSGRGANAGAVRRSTRSSNSVPVPSLVNSPTRLWTNCRRISIASD